MSGPLIPFVLGYLFGKASATTLFKWPWETSYQGAPPVHHGAAPVHAAPSPFHAPLPPLPDGVIPASTSTAAPWHEAAPRGLPPFPSGWSPGPTTQANVARAWALMSTLPVNQTKYESGPDGGWLAFHASKAPDGKKHVTVWHPKQQQRAVPS